MATTGTIKDMFGKFAGSATMASNGAASGETTANSSASTTNGTAAKRMSLERVYQKKTPLEHILLRPDTYIGSVEPLRETAYVYDESVGMTQREITYVPGLYKIFDEILVNAADNKQRDNSMDTIKVDIDSENNVISVYNNGKGIPVAMHKTEKMYVPTMIFGHLLTSSNYNDEEQKVTGGRNGYGAKLCNIFSTKFVLETASKEYKRSFKQTWANNMSKMTEPKIKDFSGSDFTKVTFSPDLSKFKMDSLDKDTVALLSRRAYDVAASTRGVKVFLNGKRLPVKTFKDYVDLYLKDKTDEADQSIRCVYENCGPRWEVAIALSDKGFQQVSFVNSIATTKGGRHVDHVTDILIKQLIETIKKKNKGGIQIKPFQIKNHLWVFVNCLIVNPTFDSQTKENMTLQQKSFGSKCTLSDKFIGQVNKCGIVESVMAWAKFKAESQLNTKCNAKKQTKLRGIAKLEDANDAGTRTSALCTLILTEGDSAKALAVSGLGVIGRDKYGVFPLKGKPLNVREATHKQILENAEINNIIKILGLQYKKKYDSDDDLKTLRYGKLMIMTDQDQDGSHIKGLLINFLHYNWPTLLRQRFLEEFITPIVKVSKGSNTMSFFSLPEFEEWKQNTSNWNTYKVKYYKGLGTSTSVEAKEYFSNMPRHRIKFRHEGDSADRAITMAFSKKCVEERKEWLTNWMVDCRRRRELGLPELYLYEKDTKEINYADFVNKELILFSNMDNERSIPSLVDGLKPGQRKVLYTCFLRNDKREVKVAQLVGAVSEKSAYHHGEASLASTILNMAQNFVGSNNINLLQPIGQFGTRTMGGKDAASPRYIFTQLSPVTKTLFCESDRPLLRRLQDDNVWIEPEWYLPIIPMVLVNGADGIGTGWMTRIPNHNPRELVANIERMLNGEEPTPMMPWYKGFTGEIHEVASQHYMINGEVGVLSSNQLEITELPIKTWTQPYKEMLSGMIAPEKGPALISDFKEYTTDTTVKFVVSMTEDKLAEAEEKGLHTYFKLQSSMSTTSMVLFDHMGVLRRYNDVLEILREFFTLRLEYYGKRKVYLEGMLGAEAAKLSNQARFILEKCDGKLTIENKKRKDMISELARKGYDSDPVKKWQQAHLAPGTTDVDQGEESQEDEEANGSQADDDRDFEYLLGMKLWSLTAERKAQILQNRDLKLQELNVLRSKTPPDLWREDLKLFMTTLDDWEKKERQDQESANSKSTKQKLLTAGRKNLNASSLCLPSASARRIVPVITDDQRKKVEAAQSKKEPGAARGRKRKAENGDAEGGVSATKIKKPTKPKDGMKQPTLEFRKSSPKKRPGKAEWETDSEQGSDDSLLSDGPSAPPIRSPREGRRAASTKVQYKFGEDSEDGSGGDGEGSSDEEELIDNAAVCDADSADQPDVDDDLDTSAVASPTGSRSTKAMVVSDTDSEFDGSPPTSSATDSAKAASPKKPCPASRKPGPASKKPGPASKKPCPASKKPGPASKKAAAAPKRKPKAMDSDSDDFSAKPKKAAAKSKVAKKAAGSDSSFDGDSDDDDGYVPLQQRAMARARSKPTNYCIDSDSE